MALHMTARGTLLLAMFSCSVLSQSLEAPQASFGLGFGSLFLYRSPFAVRLPVPPMIPREISSDVCARDDLAGAVRGK